MGRNGSSSRIELWHFMMAVQAGFQGDVTSSELARRGVQRGEAEASSSSGVQRVSVVTWSV